jgi:hypothetical protein
MRGEGEQTKPRATCSSTSGMVEAQQIPFGRGHFGRWRTHYRNHGSIAAAVPPGSPARRRILGGSPSGCRRGTSGMRGGELPCGLPRGNLPCGLPQKFPPGSAACGRGRGGVPSASRRGSFPMDGLRAAAEVRSRRAGLTSPSGCRRSPPRPRRWLPRPWRRHLRSSVVSEQTTSRTPPPLRSFVVPERTTFGPKG